MRGGGGGWGGGERGERETPGPRLEVLALGGGSGRGGSLATIGGSRTAPPNWLPHLSWSSAAFLAPVTLSLVKLHMYQGSGGDGAGGGGGGEGGGEGGLIRGEEGGRIGQEHKRVGPLLSLRTTPPRLSSLL